MILYGLPLSPFFERCFLVAQEKGQAEAITMGGVPGNALHSAEHMAHNPFGKIPYLEMENGSKLVEGQIVAEYLDGVLDGPAMLSSDAGTRAQQQLVCRMVDMYVIEPLLAVNRGADGEAKVEAMENAKAALDKFEHFFNPGKYAVGDVFSIADCALIPYVFHYSRAIGDTDFSAWPKLASWWAGISDSDVAKTCLARMGESLKMVIAMRAAAAAAEAAAE